MDTKPIFDFLNELEFRSRYIMPTDKASKEEVGHSQGEYFRVLRIMKGEFEASLFQCKAEDKDFNTDIIYRKLADCIHYHESFKDRVKPFYHSDRYVALCVAKETLQYLYENGYFKSDSTKEDVFIEDTDTKPSKDASAAPHFMSLNITVEQADALYDKLIQGRLEDTGKAGFIYYFTGVGEPPSMKLKWKSDAIFLSILMEKLSPNRIPWTMMGRIFEGLKIGSMRSNLWKERNRSSDAYSSNYNMICQWLKTSNTIIVSKTIINK